MNPFSTEHRSFPAGAMSSQFKSVTRLPEFERDIRKLKKRLKTIEEDLDTMINTALILRHKLGTDNKGIFPISGLGISNREFYKVKKFACRSLPGKGVRTGLRVIYTYDAHNDHVELIEIYYKQDQENEDRSRIRKNYGEANGGD